MFLIFLILMQVTGSTDSRLVGQSKSQASYYINNIEKGVEVEAHLWALTVLATENEKVRDFIELEVQRGFQNKVLEEFTTVESKYTDQLSKIVFHTGSSDLLIDLLLMTEEKVERQKLYNQFINQVGSQSVASNFEKICSSIINNNRLDDGVISNQNFSLSHFFFLYRDYKLLPAESLDQIINNWAARSEKGDSMHATLYRTAYLRALYLQYEYGRTFQLYNELISDANFPNSSLKLRIYRYLDYSMYRLGYYDRSLKIVRNYTLPLADYLGKDQQKLSLKQLQGVYLYSIGKIEAARAIYSEVLEEAIEKNIRVSFSSLYNNMALVENGMGKYNNYLELQFKGLEIAKKNENLSHQIEILTNLFIYYRESNNPNEALLYLDKALVIAQEAENKEALGKIYTSYGSFHRKFTHNFKKAFQYYKKAQNVLKPDKNIRRYIFLLNEKAEIHIDLKQFHLAIKQLNRILHLTKEEKGIDYIDALVNKSLVYLKMDNIGMTKEMIDQFQTFDLSKLAFQQVIKAKTVESNYLLKTDKPVKAIQILEPTLEQVVVRAKSSTDLKSGFWHVEDEYLDAFELAVEIYKDTNQPEKAIEKLDQLKTINDASFYQNPLVKSSLLNESELTQYKQLTSQLDATRKKLLTAPENRHFEIRQAISQLKLKKRKLDRKLTKSVDSNTISVRDVQNKLSARELVLHITELKDKYYLAQISRSDVQIRTIPLDSKLRNLLSTSVQQVANHETNLDSLYKIAQILDLNRISDRIEKVTLVPDSYFYQLPIDILPVDKPEETYSYGSVTYTIEKFRTQYLTSLNEFRKPDKPPEPNKINYVGYGVSNFSGYNNKSLVPLPFAQTEVTTIAERLTNLPSVHTYINEQSTKNIFTQTAPQANIIHLATHSEVSERDPMFSTVYMSKNDHSANSTFEDQVFAYELFELNLSNEMVMLNSCESGSGSYIQGTGVMGISRALQYAGAQSLILNLWSVNDMLASDFAIHFYEQLNEGKSKSEALRNTKRYFLRTKNANPHFWGPYILIGNSEPIVKPNEDENLAMAGAFIFYFLLMVGLSYFTQQGIIFPQSER